MLHVSNVFLINGIGGLLYLDPGSGSVLLQVLIAVLLGLGIAIRAQWKRIKSWFTPSNKSEAPSEHDK